MEHDRLSTIVLLEQAKNEIDKAITDLRSRFDSGAIFSLEDAMTCVKTAQDDLKEGV